MAYLFFETQIILILRSDKDRKVTIKKNLQTNTLINIDVEPPYQNISKYNSAMYKKNYVPHVGCRCGLDPALLWLW